MGPVPFALSVHHFINSVGADAGFASIIGLAIVILLWFAQARETASLREHAAEAAQRIQQLEARIVQLTRGKPAAAQRSQAPAVAPAPAGARVDTGVGAAVGAVAAGIALASPRAALSPVPPGAPAGVGAPALTAATRLIPADAPAAEQQQQPVPVGVPAGVPAEVPAAAPVPSAAPSESWPPSNTDSFVTPPPATAAAGANGATHERGTAAAVTDPPPRVQLRSSTPSPPPRRPVPPPPPPLGPAGQRSGASRGLIAVLGVLLIGAVVAVLLIATSGGGAQKSASQTQTSNAPAAGRKSKHKAAPAFNPATVTVSVLNGTSITNLAHRVGQQLAAMGYKEGTIATAADQTHTTTIVEYEPDHRSNAVHVATSLKLTSAAVQPIDPTTQQVACPPPGTCTATVVVTVGTNLGNTT